MASIKLFLSFLFFVSLSFTASARADVGLQYEQTSDFWHVFSELKSGTGSIAGANQLLNDTYGKPVAEEITLRYRPHLIDQSELTLREFAVNETGYAVSSNPVLPRLFGWVGYGPQAVVGFQFVEIYGGYYWAKRADAVSTDLIDRTILQNENLYFLGAGVNEHLALPIFSAVPMELGLYSRSTYFHSNLTTPQWNHRWRIDLTTDVSAAYTSETPAAIDTKILILTGPQPIPGFEDQARVWDYLWNVQAFPDFLSAVGLGAKIQFAALANISITGGFFGGYGGIILESDPTASFKINLHSVGIETSTAYQTQEMRLWGGSLSYSF